MYFEQQTWNMGDDEPKVSQQIRCVYIRYILRDFPGL